MSDSGNTKVSHAAEPSNQYAAITGLTAGADPSLPGSFTYQASPGTLDAQFSDTVDLPYFAKIRALYVGVSGDLKVNDWDGNTVVFKAVPVGVLPIRPMRIWSTGTTATNVVGLR